MGTQLTHGLLEFVLYSNYFESLTCKHESCTMQPIQPTRMEVMHKVNQNVCKHTSAQKLQSAAID
jgi:hypothetical protein